MSSLIQGFQARQDHLQGHMTSEGFDALIVDAREAFFRCDSADERVQLRSVISWAREGRARCSS
jgi:hypothetical protein